jgi:predicted NAD/FAD-binding protein
MRIAVVGGGIAGITAAHVLAKRHEVTLFEKNGYVGGHTHTRSVTEPSGRSIPIDTGFIVCNPKNYPNFFKLLAELRVELQPSDMSFGFVCENSGVCYVGPSIKEFLRTWTNLLSPRFLAFILEQARFNRRLTAALKRDEVPAVPLTRYLDDIGASEFLRRNYLAPLIAAIWSSPDVSADEFPLPTFARFFANHGMLEFAQRPEWFTVRGGSQTYVQAFLKAFPGTVRIGVPVGQIRREASGCRLTVDGGEELEFDKVIIAAHADEALSLLADPSPEERAALGAWRYSRNHVVLHTDQRLMPRSRRVWAAWNYYRPAGAAASAPVAITYYMNRLQRLETTTDYFVSLNQRAAIDPATIVFETTYTHPIYDTHSVASQAAIRQLNGVRHTHYCGAYLGYGFHEDGVVAALDAVRSLGGAL